MFGLSDNTTGMIAFFVFILFICMHSSSALRGQDRGGSTRRCQSCGFTVGQTDVACPNCNAKLEDRALN